MRRGGEGKNLEHGSESLAWRAPMGLRGEGDEGLTDEEVETSPDFS